MYPTQSLFIDGEFIGPSSSRKGEDILNPATGEVLGQLPHVTEAELDRAVDAAERAFNEWRTTSPMLRSEILRRVGQLARERVEDIARNMTLDQGKLLAEARAEVMACAEHAEWHAEECRRIYGRVIPPRFSNVRQYVMHEPVGVCAAFTPWNFPFNQAIRKMVAAIGAGCTIVLKGPEDSPSAVTALAQLFKDAGLPDGVLNIVWGVPAEVSTRLIESPRVRKVSFTGSSAVGKSLASLAGKHMKRATMELGGQAPFIISEDADLDKAADLLSALKLRNAGQVCVAPTRVFTHESLHGELVDRMVAKFEKVRVGDGLDSESGMGPLAHGRRLSAMTDFIADSVHRGGKVAVGGEAIQSPGNFFSPAIVTDLDDDSRVMSEETFGPILPLVSYRTLDEVIERANRSPYGLAAYAFARDNAIVRRLADEIEVGMMNINHFGMSLSETPFGGVKDSGMGREGGAETFESYLNTKFVTEAA